MLTKVINDGRESSGESFERYQTVLDSQIRKCDERFKDLEKHEITSELAFQLYILDFSEARKKFQMKLIELSEYNIVKSQLENKEDTAKI